MTVKVEKIVLLVTMVDDAADAVLGGSYRDTVSYDLGAPAALTNVPQATLTAARQAVLAEFRNREAAVVAQVKNPPAPAPVVLPTKADQIAAVKDLIGQQQTALASALDTLAQIEA